MKRIADMYMTFKGVSNEDVGALLVGMPTRQQTAIRGEKLALPGRDGFLLVPNGYQEITVKQDLAVRSGDDLPGVKRWLSGSGDLSFGDFPEYAYEAAVITPLAMSSITRRLEGQRFTVTFTCQPFLHLVRERPIELYNSGVFAGRGDVNARPLVAVEGSGAETLEINGRSMLLSLTAGVPLYIDNDAGTAYTMGVGGPVFAGGQVSVADDWFELFPKSKDPAEMNGVYFGPGITKVTLTPRWRWF